MSFTRPQGNPLDSFVTTKFRHKGISGPHRNGNRSSGIHRRKVSNMGKEEGFVKIYRSLIDDPIWLNSTPAQKAVLITLMCMVTWKPRKWDVLGKPITLKPGQCFTSLSEIALRAGDGVSREVVRKALARFETLVSTSLKKRQRTQQRTQREHSENTARTQQ